ncbi:MAG: transketolase [Anaerolineae bacterium]|nr:transketolase [Anaerolineae bacterium]
MSQITDVRDLETTAINAIRFLSADAVQQANSGHPGLPMGTAALAYTLWTRHLRHNPKHPGWANRDRFILSGGHGSMLLYSLLHLTGYDLPLDELKKFRQWGSLTPGHPEYGLTPGVETTTGPLGQGFANGVGMAIAEAHLAATFNRDTYNIIDHYTYAIVTDGDLMEGVASEAASLAGHLRLGKLIYLYDDNHISIDGSTDLAFTEDRGARFEAYGWQVLHVADGNDVETIDAAISAAKDDPRPSLIVCRTHIGYGLPTKQDTAAAHGEPPGNDELNGAKEKLAWPLEPRFYLPGETVEFFRSAIERGAQLEETWSVPWQAYQRDYPDLAADLDRRLNGQLPADWHELLPTFAADAKGIATRVASGKVINALAAKIPELVGGSADLAPSNKTWIDGEPDFQADTPAGRNFHFGVREHGMTAILNGMAVHGGLRPYGGTFLVFADYMRPAIRVAALSHLPTILVFTHDSIGLGEDGPTHQPIEHLATLRAIPNLVTLRPADANETTAAWQVALERRNGPTALALTRQNVPILDRARYGSAQNVGKGAYILADLGEGAPALILMASGSEVELIVAAGQQLTADGIGVRLISFPSWELFEAQPKSYQNQVLPPHLTARLAVEAGIAQGWHRWVGSQGDILALNRFGASAPYKTLYDKLGLTVANVVQRAKQLL